MFEPRQTFEKVRSSRDVEEHARGRNQRRVDLFFFYFDRVAALAGEKYEY